MSVNRKSLCRAGHPFLAAIAVIAISLAMADLVPAAQESAPPAAKSENKAAAVAVTGSSFEREAGGQAAPAGKVFLVLDTEWTNIHPKRKIEKSKLEGKSDRTMGAGGLMGGGRSGSDKKEELVEVDVAYVIPSFFDHAYVLADGESLALDKATGSVPGAAAVKKGLSLPKRGDTQKVRLAYLVPSGAKNLAFQFFDYSFGHILIPVKGDLKLAAGSAGAGPALGRFKDEALELAATGLDFPPAYAGREAPEGWRYAVVKVSGTSLSGGATKNIVQIKPQGFIWLATPKGHLYYATGGSTTPQGVLRFTPEFAQSQEVAFLVPASETKFSLGVRLQNRVHALALNTPPPTVPPDKPLATHADGDTLEIFVFGVRRDGGHVVIDLGVRSLVKSGADIQPKPQFILEAGGKDVAFDAKATEALPHRPPTPFTVPPQGFVRFELAYATQDAPGTLRYRGYRSEGRLDLSGTARK